MDIRELDLNLLVVLDALLDCGQTTQTAKRLSMSQPSVSYALNKLRDSFGDALFVREGNRLVPTPRALSLKEPVRQMVQLVRDEIARDDEFDPAQSERCFTVSMSDIGELVFCPDILRTFAAEAPKSNLRCLSMPPAELEAALADGSVDIALGYFPDLEGPGIYQQSLFRHSFTCLARADHPGIGETLTLDAFLAAEHCVVSQEGRSQEIFEGAMNELNLARRVTLQTPHFMSIPYIVATTDLITVVPKAVAKACAVWAPVQLLEPPFEVPAIELKQFWHARSRTDKAASWLRGLIMRHFQNRDPTEEVHNPIFGKPGSH